MHGVYHGLDIDGRRDVVDVPDQRSEADQSQHHGSGDPDMRHEASFVHGADRTQHHQRIGESAEENAESDLVAAVAHKIAQQPRPHLPRGQRQGRDGDGENRAGDADTRRRDGAEKTPRPLASARIAPGGGGRVRRGRGKVIVPGGRQSERDAEHDHEGRSQPELVAEILDPGPEPRTHEACFSASAVSRMSGARPRLRVSTRRGGMPTMS